MPCVMAGAGPEKEKMEDFERCLESRFNCSQGKMGFGLWGMGKVKEKEELKCPLVFSVGWMADGTVPGMGNTGFRRRK